MSEVEDLISDLRAWLEDLSAQEFGSILWQKANLKSLRSNLPKFCKRLANRQIIDEIEDEAVYHFEHCDEEVI